METANELCILKWNKFESNITKGLNSLRGVDDFFDVTLVGDALKQVTAHRLVLSASSEYFKKILQNNCKTELWAVLDPRGRNGTHMNCGCMQQ